MSSEEKEVLPRLAEELPNERDALGRFVAGNKVHLSAAPRSVSITGAIKQHFLEHPEELEELASYYRKDKKMRDLLWRMLDGNPSTVIKGEEGAAPFIIEVVQHEGTRPLTGKENS